MGTIESSESVITVLVEISSFWYLIQNPDVPKMGNFFMADFPRYPILEVCLTTCSLPLRKLSFGSSFLWRRIFFEKKSFWSGHQRSEQSMLVVRLQTTSHTKNNALEKKLFKQHSPGQLNQNIDNPEKNVLSMLNYLGPHIQKSLLMQASLLS